ncbi:MAG: alcohol dehydrogenase catalytic domain-containing protein [Acidimicrobiia bacterium]
MKAAVLEEIGRLLCLREVAVPEPGAGEVLVEVVASGVCNGDVYAAAGKYPSTATPVVPRIPGHRGVGTVVQIGPGVTRVREGDRVGVPLVVGSCGECQACFSGQERLCPGARFGGFQADGCHAQYVRADARYVGLLPPGLAWETAAQLTCTGVTALGALRQAEVRSGQWCAVFGLGAVGETVVALARACGLQVVAVSGVEEAGERARRQGVQMVLHRGSCDPVRTIRSEIGGVHAAIVTSIRIEAFEQALKCLRPGGTLVAVGLELAELPVPLFSLVMKQVSVRGSFVGDRNDLQEAYTLAVINGIELSTEDQPLEAVNEVYARILEGSSSARVLLRPGS